MIVKGTTKSGIKFKLDDKIKDDTRLVFLLTKAQKNEDDPMEASKDIMNLLTLIFGSDDNVLDFMNEVADKHKGVCSTHDMIAEMQEMFDAINSKNS